MWLMYFVPYTWCNYLQRLRPSIMSWNWALCLPWNYTSHTVPCAALIMTREYRVVQSLEEFRSSSSSIAVWDILWLAGCKLGGVAGHEAISWFSAAAFQARKWVQIRKVPSSVARSNTLPTSWLTCRHIRPFHSNPRVSLKEWLNSRCHHCRDTLLPTVAKTDVATRAFDLRTTMEVLRQVQIIQFFTE